MKKILLILLIFLSIFVVFFVFYLADDKDYCLDTQMCKENLIINTEYGEIIINKENCIKNGWEWFEKQRTCKVKK